MTRSMNINTIRSEDLEECLAYSDSAKLYGTDYGTLIKALVYTMKKSMAVEILANDTNEILKIEIREFTLSYVVGEEGSTDSLSISYNRTGEENVHTLSFKVIGCGSVIKDKKSSSRTYYRYYIDGNRSTGCRLTFNRRITKD